MRTKEEMAAYQKKRRAVLRGLPLTDKRPSKCPDCVELMGEIEDLNLEIKGLTAALPTVGAVGVCGGCSDKDMANKILRAKVLMLEKELGLLKREKKVEREEAPKSPYRLGPGV